MIASLNSGSNGNCYYVGDDHDAILVDAGISCRETERRMARLGLSPDKVRAVFISHEHSDHTRGVRVLSKKHRIPVFITERTRQAGGLYLEPSLLHDFIAGRPLTFGRLTVHPFGKHHDGADPHSFTISSNGLCVGVFTDIGRVCDRLTEHFSQCHAAFLEANYDHDMLEKGGYPAYLKRRIRGGEGHLSNDQSLDLFLNHRHHAMSLLILSHLSANNNHPNLVRTLFAPHANGTRIEIASRYEASELFVLDR